MDRCQHRRRPAAHRGRHSCLIVAGMSLTDLTPPRARARARGDWPRRFLKALEDTGGMVTTAAQVAGISRQAAYDLRKRDPRFAEKWDDAVAAAVDQLEAVAYRRAMDSSDKLLMFLLRARRPEVYCERYQVRHVARPAALREEVDRDRELYNDPEV